jgi:Uncharacterized conserved protein
MMISNVKGEFRNFSAEIEAEDDTFKNAKVNATIQTDSIDTNNADRDAHLKGEDFFDAAKNPTITFSSDSLNDDITGNLTINGITKPVKLDVDFGGINVDPWGNTKSRFLFRRKKYNRKEFRIKIRNAALETGGVLVSDEVKIAGELQFVKA